MLLLSNASTFFSSLDELNYKYPIDKEIVVNPSVNKDDNFFMMIYPPI